MEYMNEITVTLQFLTPAFLGNAEQRAQLRAPPFAHLLRRWWRVAHLAAHGFSAEAMKPVNLFEQEIELFGGIRHKAKKGQAASVRSAVRVRLVEAWRPGGMGDRDWRSVAFGSFWHADVHREVRTDLYLAYGPVNYDRQARRPVLQRKAIAPGTRVRVRISWPRALNDALRIRDLLTLVHCLGAVGGRSRNGWGSLAVVKVEGLDEPPSLPGTRKDLGRVLKPFSRPWTQALKLDWPHCIGADERGLLVWLEDAPVGTGTDWPDAIDRLATHRYEMRVPGFPFHGGSTQNPENRHLIALPVTRHQLRLGKGAGRLNRMANQLWLRVFRDAAGRLYPMAVHLPQGLPEPLGRRPMCPSCAGASRLASSASPAVWRQVHELLDARLLRA